MLQQSAVDARQRLALTTEGLEVFTPQRRWDAQQGRPAPAPTPELLDIVGMCNKAARVHRGGLVWLGWNPTPDRKWKANKPKRIANGSNCIAVTAAGARWLQPRLEAMDKTQMRVRCCVWTCTHASAERSSRPCTASATRTCLHFCLVFMYVLVPIHSP